MPAPLPADRTRLQHQLLAWYQLRKRVMPWRGLTDPYPIWISEIMLQQTRVEAVVPYFERFIARFPTVEALAAGPLDEVLRLWAGLGYYSRARNLFAAAQHIVTEHGGRFPTDPVAVRALPGVGRYTAGAIGSIAFGQRVPLVDGNVVRVLSRLFLVEDMAATAAGQKRFWSLATALVEGLRDDESPGDFNQALMELGATVCLPQRPRCDDCPVRTHCRARDEGVAETLPKKRAVKESPAVNWISVRVRDRTAGGGRVLLVRRLPEGLWGGLWEFPSGEAGNGEILEEAALRTLVERTGLLPDRIQAITTFDHVLSHLRLRIHLFDARAEGRLELSEYDAAAWLGPDEVATRGVAAWMQPLLSSKNGRSHA